MHMPCMGVPSTARKVSHKMHKGPPPIIMSHEAMNRCPAIARVATNA